MTNKNLIAYLFAAFFALTCMAHAATTPVKIVLPDSGAYYWWMQSPSGSIADAPRPTAGKRSITIPSSDLPGTFDLLDKHTGEIVQTTVTTTSGVVNISIGDFHGLAAPVQAPAPATQTAAAPLPKPAVLPTSSPFGTIVTFLLGIAVLAGVIWLLREVINSKGKFLTDMARKAGVDVPDPESTRIAADQRVEGRYDPPAPRPIERVPDDALASPVSSVAGARLVGISGPGAGQVFSLPRGGIVIGREDGCTIKIADPSISQRHAKIELRADGGYLIHDEGSANGIYLNGQRVSEGILQASDLLRIGEATLRFER